MTGEFNEMDGSSLLVVQEFPNSTQYLPENLKPMDQQKENAKGWRIKVRAFLFVGLRYTN